MEYNIKDDVQLTKLKNAKQYGIRQREIMDTEAEEYSQLKDSYVGKYVAHCTICNQDIYIPTPDLTQIEKCPWCKFSKCFVLAAKMVDATIDKDEAEKPNPLYDNVYGVKIEEGLDSYARRKLNSKS